MTERVFIIGPGHVGRGLFRAFRASGVDVVGMHGKRPSGVATSTGSIPADAARANVVFVCVRDSQLDETIEEVIVAANDGRMARDHRDPAHIGNRRTRGTRYAVEGRLSWRDFSSARSVQRSGNICRAAQEGMDRNRWRERGEECVAAAGGAHGGRACSKFLPARSPRTTQAAVISSNFPVVLASIAGICCMTSGSRMPAAYQAVESLMRGALTNMKQTLPDDALTGPIMRGDMDTIGKHLRALQGNEAASEVYRALSLAAVEIAGRRGVDGKKLLAVSGLLRSRK